MEAGQRVALLSELVCGKGRTVEPPSPLSRRLSHHAQRHSQTRLSSSCENRALGTALHMVSWRGPPACDRTPRGTPRGGSDLGSSR